VVRLGAGYEAQRALPAVVGEEHATSGCAHDSQVSRVDPRAVAAEHHRTEQAGRAASRVVRHEPRALHERDEPAAVVPG